MRIYDSIKQYQKDIIKGLLMGDGSIAGNSASSNANAFFTLQMTNKKFLDYTRKIIFPELANDIRKQRTSEQSIRVANKSLDRTTTSAKAYYELRFSRHPYFSKLRETWYRKGYKKFPKEPMTDNKLKMWYICDGSYSQKRAKISAHNEKESLESLAEILKDEGLSPNTCGSEIYFNTYETEEFFDYIGSPPPGFSYKWP